MTAASGQLFFTARGADGVIALWRSDGTAKGTYRVSPAGVSFVNVTAIHPGPGFLYLCDAGSGAKTGLWRSDGTRRAEPTFLAPLRCFDPYIDHDSNAALLPNGDLLVSAAGPLGGEELWRSDGTPGGTTLVADLRPGDIGSQPMHFARLGAEVVFTAGNGAGEASLYRSDGTTPGTTAVPLPPGASPYPSFGPWAGDGARYYFGGRDAAHGLEPWVFDGLTAQLLADVVPGPTSSLDEEVFNRSFFAVLGGVLVFSADDGVNGEEIWRSDGTGPGTYRLSDLGPGPDPMAIVMWDGWHRPSVIDDQLYFFEEQSPDGYRLSRTDGTTVGPAVIRSIDNQSSAFDPVARDRGSLLEYDLGHNCFAATGAHIFFEQERAETYEPDLWMTDGSLAGTGVALAGFDSGYGFTPCAGTGDRLLFFDTQENQQALRALSPDAAPPVELLAGYGGSTMPPFLPSGPGLVFAMTDGLYRSDGTSGGTALIATTSFATWLAPWGDEVLFGGEALWATQPASTEPLELTPPASVTAVNEIVTLGSRIVFVAESDAAGSELWVSQGVPGDATLLADLLPGSTGALATRRRPRRNDGRPRAAARGARGCRAVRRADSGPRTRALGDRRHRARHRPAARHLPRRLSVDAAQSHSPGQPHRLLGRGRGARARALGDRRDLPRDGAAQGRRAGSGLVDAPTTSWSATACSTSPPGRPTTAARRGRATAPPPARCASPMSPPGRSPRRRSASPAPATASTSRPPTRSTATSSGRSPTTARFRSSSTVSSRAIPRAGRWRFRSAASPGHPGCPEFAPPPADLTAAEPCS